MPMMIAFVLLAGIFVYLNRQSDRPVESQKSCRIVGDAAVLWLSAFVYLFLLWSTRRFWTSSALGLTLILTLWAGNGLKKQLLGESLVFSDIFLVGHALRYPRLYFGYVPTWVWVVLAVVLTGLVCIAQSEASLSYDILLKVFDLWLGITISGALFIWWMVRSDRTLGTESNLTFNAVEDAARYTPLGAAVVHTIWHLRRGNSICQTLRYPSPKGTVAKKTSGDALRHFVLIQAESYCPIARMINRASVTPTLDQIRSSTKFGRLLMNWRGAYTMRTEFSVLTGLRTTALETYGFDPYRLAATVEMDSLARDFKSAGFETVAWHPNDGRFFDRTHVLLNLGFDHFVDSKDLSYLSRCGLYTSDEALLTAAGEFLSKASRSTFLFIVTMEGHGPWKLDAAKSEIEYYEDRLASLDRGVQSLLSKLQSLKCSAQVALYGDHLPGLQVLREISDQATEWLLWSNRKSEACSQTLSVEQMRTLICQEVLK